MRRRVYHWPPSGWAVLTQAVRCAAVDVQTKSSLSGESSVPSGSGLAQQRTDPPVAKSTTTTTNTAATPTSKSNNNNTNSSSAQAQCQTVEEATAQLRRALEAFSEVEQAKADALFLKRQKEHSERVRAAAAAAAATAVTTDKKEPQAQQDSDASNAPNMSRSAAIAGSASNDATTSTTPDATSGSSNSPADDALQESTWIRNKRPKFWAIVYPTTTATMDIGVGPVGVAAKSDDTAGTQVTSTAPPLESEASKDNVAVTNTSSNSSNSSTSASSSSTNPAKVDPGSIRVSIPLRPFRSPYKQNVAAGLSELLNRDDTLGPVLLSQLSAESRRLLLVMGTASEYFGGNYEEVVEQVKAADKDKDSSISAQEYESWALRSYQMRHPTSSGSDKKVDPTTATATATASTAVPTTATTSSSTSNDEKAKPTSSAAADSSASRSAKETTPVAAEQSTSGSSKGFSFASLMPPTPPSIAAMLRHYFLQKNTPTGEKRTEQKEIKTSNNTSSSTSSSSSSVTVTADPSYIPWGTYARLVFAAAAPFLAFGMLDNSTLIFAGDAIDRSLSETFQLSSMAAAGMGGIVSGVAGIQVHGLAERWTRAAPPPLSPQQYRSAAYGRSERLGNTMGMGLGLLLGMTPLLFLRRGGEEEAEDEATAHKRLREEAERSRQNKKMRHVMRQHEEQGRHQVVWEEAQARAEILKAMEAGMPTEQQPQQQ